MYVPIITVSTYVGSERAMERDSTVPWGGNPSQSPEAATKRKVVRVQVFIMTARYKSSALEAEPAKLRGVSAGYSFHFSEASRLVAVRRDLARRAL